MRERDARKSKAKKKESEEQVMFIRKEFLKGGKKDSNTLMGKRERFKAHTHSLLFRVSSTCFLSLFIYFLFLFISKPLCYTNSIDSTGDKRVYVYMSILVSPKRKYSMVLG